MADYLIVEAREKISEFIAYWESKKDEERFVGMIDKMIAEARDVDAKLESLMGEDKSLDRKIESEDEMPVTQERIASEREDEEWVF